MVNEQGSKPYPTKVCVISKFSIPSSIMNVWAFLGSLDIIEHLSRGMLVGPLFDLTRKDLLF